MATDFFPVQEMRQVWPNPWSFKKMLRVVTIENSEDTMCQGGVVRVWIGVVTLKKVKQRLVTLVMALPSHWPQLLTGD
jgi:hypothetical protein